MSSLAEENFNELDNWLGIMDLDPPRSAGEKQVMYGRLLEILDSMFKKPTRKKSSPTTTVNKEVLQRQMRKIIVR